MPDTIFAQATAPGRSGVAIIRISGPSAHEGAVRLTGAPLLPRRATLRRVCDPFSREAIDDALLVYFPAPASYTGEAVVEVQCHGSLAVSRRLLAVLASFGGFRLAAPGEFTRRALENGRLDLSQVEGLADLLAAETEAQRRQALAVAAGAVSRTTERWRVDLLGTLALVEAVIDFGEDGVPDSTLEFAPVQVQQVSAEMDDMLDGCAAAERIRDGFTVALCGEPNVGKSTLLNAIAGREVALTSEVAGTTRDVLEVFLDLRGLPVTLLDTAGLRQSDDYVERLGIDRAITRSAAADLRIYLTEAASSAHEKHMQDGDILVRAKSDLGSEPGGLAVSGVTGEGVDQLLERISSVLEVRASGASGLTRQRQRQAVRTARMALGRCLENLQAGGDGLELVACALRDAVRALDMLAGKVDVEAVLDQVFRTFCLGK